MLEFEVYTTHERSTWHGIAFVDFVVLCKKVFAAYPETDVSVQSVTNGGIQQTDVFFRFVFAYFGVESAQVLQSDYGIPLAIVAVGTYEAFILGSTYYLVLHVEEGMVGIQTPMGVDAISSFEFATTVFNFSSVHVFLVHGLNHIVALDEEEVCSIADTTETMAPGEFVVHKTLRLQFFV